MAQVLEKEEIYIIIPEVEEKAERVEKKSKKAKRKVNAGSYAKDHEEKIYINKMKNTVDASTYIGGYYPQ